MSKTFKSQGKIILNLKNNNLYVIIILSQKHYHYMKGGVSVGTLQNLVSGERKRRRIEESDIVFNDGKAKKRRTFDEKGWNEAYQQACDDLTPEELEACQYVTSKVLTPEEFAAL